MTDNLFYKIYIDTGIVLLVQTKDLSLYIMDDHHEYSIKAYNGKRDKLLKYIEQLETKKKQRILIHYTDINTLWKDFKSHYRQVKAAGGLVQNPEGSYLFIFRRGMWDLPKGKLEPDEFLREAATREVKEECGLEQLEIVKKICVTYHTYGEAGTRKLKDSHWYHMRTTDHLLVPQYEEDIEQAEWQTMEQFFRHKRKVYSSIMEVLETHIVDHSNVSSH